MNRYQQTFNKLKQTDELGLVPFTVLGYPNRSESLEIIKTFIESGADMLELGIPYSDPIADGPVIQVATHKAIDSGNTMNDSFQILTDIRTQFFEIPIGLLVYAQSIFAFGIDKFFKKCNSIGIDSVLIADLPFEHRDEFKEYSDLYDISLVFIIAPNTSESTIEMIQNVSDAYVYVLRRNGITGVQEFGEKNAFKISEDKSVPHLLGFGISEAVDVFEAGKLGFDGVIIGSKMIQVYDKSGISGLNKYIQKMKEATKFRKLLQYQEVDS